MDSYIDVLAAETEEESEWSLSGWAFVPDDLARHGRLELQGKDIGSFSCGWHRPDVLAAFPARCPSENVGFMGLVLLPSGLQAGEHILELVFFNQRHREIGRIRTTLVTKKETKGTFATAHAPVSNNGGLQSAYLDLLEKTILGLPYVQDHEVPLRNEGRDWPQVGHSMIGMERLRHLRACAETVLRENVPGDFMETGVWRGGACILLRGLLRAYDNTSRRVWVADSFEGIPSPNREKYPDDAESNLHTFKELAIPLEQVQEHFHRYGLLDGQVKFLKGWFSQSLPAAPIDQLAILRLDGDLYESTTDALAHLYPKLSPGGFCIIDDYGAIPACRKAVRDYRVSHGIKEPMAMIDWTGAWWRKS